VKRSGKYAMKHVPSGMEDAVKAATKERD